jgi:hypothetical protein
MIEIIAISEAHIESFHRALVASPHPSPTPFEAQLATLRIASVAPQDDGICSLDVVAAAYGSLS